MSIAFKLKKLAGAGLLALAASSISSMGLAQDSLVELVKAGDEQAVLEAIQSSGMDVNERAADGSTALHWATYQADIELVKTLLDAGAEADVTNNYGSTPLTEAVKLSNAELVSSLLAAGADPDSPNQDNQTALMVASHLGSLQIAELLLEHGADVDAVESFRGQTALMWAAAENNPAIAELLVKNDADLSIRAVHDDWPRQMTSEPRAQFRPTGGLTALLYATRSGCYRCAVAIVEGGADINQPNPDGITPLLNAIDARSFDIAMYLIDQGANVHVWDMNGRTPIYMAVDMNSFEPRGPAFFGGFGGGESTTPQQYTAMDIVDRLLDMGVDVNHQLTRIRPNGPGRGRFADYDMRGGVGPLFVAALSNDHESMEKLLAHGAAVDLRSVFRMTPLMIAAGMRGTNRRAGNASDEVQMAAIKSIDILLEGGADINAAINDSHTYTAKLDTYIQGRDQEGRTALHSAAELGWDQVVQHLLENGADPAVTDANGNTILDAALAPIASGPGARGPRDESGREATVALIAEALNVPVPAMKSSESE